MPSKKSLLERRVREFKIPKWPGRCSFERVLIYRIPDDHAANEKTASGLLYKPSSRKATDEARSPRGIIVSAGLEALDIMRAHGKKLGDLVWFAPWTPQRFEVGRTEKADIDFDFMNVGEIVLDEDEEKRIESGELTLVFQDGKHKYLAKDGSDFDRVDPTHYPDES